MRDSRAKRASSARRGATTETVVRNAPAVRDAERRPTAIMAAAPPKKRKTAAAPTSFSEGDRVECFFRDWEKYFPATVRRVNDDLTYDVDYDDGYAEENLSAKLLKSPTRLRSKRARKARFT